MDADTECPHHVGGHMSSISGRVLHVAGTDLPYTVVLTTLRGFGLYQSFRTMREAESVHSAKYSRPRPGAFDIV